MSSQIHLLSQREIFRRWWPLAASWMLMGAELPVVSAMVARLADPEINLAAYGGVVFPLALIIESPIIMLLAASTALSRDWLSYQKIRRIMMTSGCALTLLHMLVAFTPLYYVVVNDIIGAPADVVEPARIGLMIMTPWTWSIAYRRFQQGVLIRFDHSRAVTMGTMIRLISIASVLLAGYVIQSLPGVIVAAAAVAAGVLAEAVYAGFRVRPVIKSQLKQAPKVEPELTLKAFAHFYTPLALTSLLTLIAMPMGSAALSRMPIPIESLAVWPVVIGLIFLLSSVGFAYQEVVVTLLDKPNALNSLKKFALKLALGTSAMILAIGLTPLAGLWFEQLSGLSSGLANLAQVALLLSFIRPALLVLQHGIQGVILHSRKTRAITEAIALALAGTAALLWAGVQINSITGIYVAVVAFTGGVLIQVSWLLIRSRSVFRALAKQSDHQPILAATGAPTE